MSKRREATPFGHLVLELMVKAGYHRQVELARASGLNESTISRVIYSPSIPDSETLSKIASGLGVSYRDLLLRAHNAMPESETPTREGVLLHPLALEISRMLAEDSPLDSADREALAVILDRLIEPYRRKMRRKASRTS